MEPNSGVSRAPVADASEAQGKVVAVLLLAAATVAFTVHFLTVATATGVMDLAALGLALLSGALLVERATTSSR